MKSITWFVIWMIFFSACNQDSLPTKNPEGPTEEQPGEGAPGAVTFMLNLHGSRSGTTRAAGLPGPAITNGTILDSLVKDLRVLVFDPITGECEAYADFAPLHLSLTDSIRMTVNVGIKDFVFLTNVSDTSVMSRNMIGKNRDQLFVKLKAQIPGNVTFYDQAKQFFYGEVKNVNVVSGAPIMQNVALMRMVGQLETYAHFLQVWKMKNNNTQKDYRLAPDYIRKMRSLVVKYIALDMSLNKNINTLPLTPVGSDTAVIVQNDWNLIDHDTVARAIVLDFSTEQINVYPTLLLAAEVNPAHPDFVAMPSDLSLANGNVIRYWWFQLKNHDFRENVRLELTLNSFLGTGSSTPPGPDPDGTVEFNITIADWDAVIDTDGGDNGDFVPL